MVKNNYEWDESNERKDKKMRHTSNAKKIREIDEKAERKRELIVQHLLLLLYGNVPKFVEKQQQLLV